MDVEKFGFDFSLSRLLSHFLMSLRLWLRALKHFETMKSATKVHHHSLIQSFCMQSVTSTMSSAILHARSFGFSGCWDIRSWLHFFGTFLNFRQSKTFKNLQKHRFRHFSRFFEIVLNLFDACKITFTHSTLTLIHAPVLRSTKGTSAHVPLQGGGEVHRGCWNI